MYNHGAVWVYDHAPVGQPFSYEPSNLGDYPATHPGRFSDHIDHHRFPPALPYSYDPYASTRYWQQYPPQLPPSHLDAYPHHVDFRSNAMPRGEIDVPSARRYPSDARPDGHHRAPSSPTLPPMTRSPSHSASSIDRSATSSIPPTTASPSPHPTASPRIASARGPYTEDGAVSYTYPPPRPRDSHPAPAYSYHPSVHPSHRYSPYHPSSPFVGSTSPPPPTTTVPSHTSTQPRNVYVHPPSAQGQSSDVIHTDDAATKLSDRVRRRCFNCCTTETSTWRRSSLNPGKVLCNKCGLFERTHSRPRPEQFPHKRGPISSAGQRNKGVAPPPFAPMAPQPSSPPAVPSVAPHHYDHPSLAPLRSRAESQKSPRMDNLPAIKSLLQSPEQASRVPSPSRPESRHLSMPSSPYSVPVSGGEARGSPSLKPKSKHTVRRSRSPTRRAAV